MSNYANSFMVSGEFEKCWKADLIGSGTGRSGNPQHKAPFTPLASSEAAVARALQRSPLIRPAVVILQLKGKACVTAGCQWALKDADVKTCKC
ncbi:hypothetical protein MHYP_G00273910 [Metynnis hypsauchen]